METAARYQGSAQNAAPQQTIEKPRLSQQIDQLLKILSVCHDSAGDLSHAADRILGPVPANAENGGPVPTPTSIEQRLQSVIDVADALFGRLQETTKRLNSAV